MLIMSAAVSASAQPASESQEKQEEAPTRVTLGDHPAHRAPAHQPGEWVELATETPAKHGQEFIVVGKDAGQLSKLRLDASKGTVIVLRVKVVYADGSTKVFPVEKRLKANGKKSTIVDLKSPKAIDRVVVKTETYTKGEYALYGTSGGGVVAGR